MSAELLWKAATFLRERAEAATPGPWWTDGVGGITVSGGPEGRGVASATNVSRPNALHIATMHPGVALAIADWLDEVAGWREEGLGLMPSTNLADAWGCIERQAIALASLLVEGARP